MKKKTWIITSILAVGLIGFAGYQASAIYTSASGNENAVPIVKESAVSLAKAEHDDSDEKQAQALVNVNDDRDDDRDDRQEQAQKAVNKDDDDNKTDKNSIKQNLITKEEAISIAKKKYAGQVSEVEFDMDDDDRRPVYEIEIQTKRGEVELEIDAKTGKIISVDFDD